MNLQSSTPLVSIVIPAHGRRALLQQTLDSVFAQTLTAWEAVVVDDRSPDDTAEWLAQVSAGDARLRPMPRTGDHGGANVARNQGVAASRGKYVVFLDSDDLLEPDCLRLRADRLESRPELDFTVHAMRCFRDQPGDTDFAWNTLTDEDDFERYLRMDGPWQTTGATWRRSALDRIGPWDPDLLSLQDLDFHLRALSADLRYAKINAWDCQYRLPQDRNSISHQNRSLAHYRSHAVIVRAAMGVSDEFLARSPDRRGLLVGFCFHIAKRIAEKGDLPAALRLWKSARQRGIVRGKRYVEGAALLLGTKTPRLTIPLKRWTFDRWPQTWRAEYRQTFLHAPLPPPATAQTPTAVAR